MICECQRIMRNNKRCDRPAVAVAVYLNQNQLVCAIHKQPLSLELSQKRVPFTMSALPKKEISCQILTE